MRKRAEYGNALTYQVILYTSRWRTQAGALPVLADSMDDFTHSHLRFFLPSQMFKIMVEFPTMIRNIAPRALPSYQLFWKDVFSTKLFAFVPGRYRECSLAMAAGYRVDGLLAVAAEVTNVSISDAVKPRSVLFEAVRLKNGRAEPIPVSLAVRNSGKLGRGGNGTAVLYSRNITIEVAHGNPASNTNTWAFRHALQFGEFREESSTRVRFFCNSSSFPLTGRSVAAAYGYVPRGKPNGRTSICWRNRHSKSVSDGY